MRCMTKPNPKTEAELTEQITDAISKDGIVAFDATHVAIAMRDHPDFAHIPEANPSTVAIRNATVQWAKAQRWKVGIGPKDRARRSDYSQMVNFSPV